MRHPARLHVTGAICGMRAEAVSLASASCKFETVIANPQTTRCDYEPRRVDASRGSEWVQASRSSTHFFQCRPQTANSFSGPQHSGHTKTRPRSLKCYSWASMVSAGRTGRHCPHGRSSARAVGVSRYWCPASAARSSSRGTHGDRHSAGTLYASVVFPVGAPLNFQW